MTAVRKTYLIEQGVETEEGVYGKKRFTMTVTIQDDGRFSGRSMGGSGRANIEGILAEDRVDFVQTYDPRNHEDSHQHFAYVVHLDRQTGAIWRGSWSEGTSYNPSLVWNNGGFSMREIYPLIVRLANSQPIRYIRNLVPQRKAA